MSTDRTPPLMQVSIFLLVGLLLAIGLVGVGVPSGPSLILGAAVSLVGSAAYRSIIRQGTKKWDWLSAFAWGVVVGLIVLVRPSTEGSVGTLDAVWAILAGLLNIFAIFGLRWIRRRAEGRS